MIRGPWSVELSESVEAFICEQTAEVQKQLRLDIIKLETRGVQASAPLVKKYRGDVYYLRRKIRGHGLFRIFYFRSGEFSFYAFHAIQKKRKRLSGKHKQAIESAYVDATGKRLT